MIARRLLGVVALLCALSLGADTTGVPAGGIAKRFIKFTAAPATCSEGDIYWDLTAHTGSFCTAENTWAAALVSGGAVVPATTCTNQFVSVIATSGAGTCTTVTLAGAQFANQGTATTVLHGNAAGNPSFAQVAIGTDVSGLGTGVATVLATPSSANLRAALTDENGTGAALFDSATSPTFVTSVTDPLLIGGTGTTSTLTLQSTSGVGAAGADILMKVGNAGGTDALHILNSGNVGIGTASPQAKLDVRGANAHSLVGSGTSDFLGGSQTGYGASNGTEQLYAAVQTGLGFVGTVSSTNFSIITGNNVWMTITNAGAASFAGALTVTGHTIFEGVTSTGATGTGNIMYSASPTTTGTLAAAAITATGAITPSQTAGIVGTTTNNNANALSFGEYKNAQCPGPATTATITVTIATPGVVTWASHPFSGTVPRSDVCPVVFTTSGALPTGITAGTTYWIIPSTISGNNFSIATSVDNAIAGTAINTTGSQSGTQTGTAGAALSTATTTNIAGVSLTAGDWDCRASLAYTFGSTTSYTNLIQGISTTSATVGAQGTFTDFETPAAVPTAGADMTWAIPTVRELLSGTSTAYLLTRPTFTLSTLKGYGNIDCRRMR